MDKTSEIVPKSGKVVIDNFRNIKVYGKFDNTSTVLIRTYVLKIFSIRQYVYTLRYVFEKIRNKNGSDWLIHVYHFDY